MRCECKKVFLVLCGALIFILLLWAVCETANAHIYERGVYDCSDMAIRDQQVFTKLGLEADIVENHQMQHAWVIVKINKKEIHWESTAIQPVSPRHYDKRLNVSQVRSCSRNPIKLFPEWCLIGQEGIL